MPAARATIGVTDRIFTRVGANDELSRGQSTFMVELTEAANILNNATSRSLVILDEIGRATSTYDGVSLAWSITEHLHTPLVAGRSSQYTITSWPTWRSPCRNCATTTCWCRKSGVR